ncbi:MAG: hypothetical protein ABMA64_37425 [Myxococcota bacterium]
MVLAWLVASAFGADDEGLEVRLRVIDAATGLPVPTAVIRHPTEQNRHRVNTVSGEWAGTMLYLPDGSELRFARGVHLELEVSAPGYVNQRLAYVVRRRKNIVDVPMVALEVDLARDAPDDVIIQFATDDPID